MTHDPGSSTAVIIQGAEPFLLRGGRSGCLLIHGFTGTPREMRGLADYLSERGHSVLGIRLSGHATRPEDLFHVRWQDWVADVETGLHLLQGCSDSIVVMGLSMGGMLALIAGARFPAAGVVAMSTPYRLHKEGYAHLRPFLPAASLALPFIGKGKPDWHDAVAAADHIDYPAYPLRAVAQLFDLLEEMRASLSSIRVPVLLVNSRQDETVTPDQAEAIAAQLGGAVETLLVEDSGHVVTRDRSNREVFEAAETFTRRVTMR